MTYQPIDFDFVARLPGATVQTLLFSNMSINYMFDNRAVLCEHADEIFKYSRAGEMYFDVFCGGAARWQEISQNPYLSLEFLDTHWDNLDRALVRKYNRNLTRTFNKTHYLGIDEHNYATMCPAAHAHRTHKPAPEDKIVCKWDGLSPQQQSRYWGVALKHKLVDPAQAPADYSACYSPLLSKQFVKLHIDRLDVKKLCKCV